jgi:hypothetical protein
LVGTVFVNLDGKNVLTFACRPAPLPPDDDSTETAFSLAASSREIASVKASLVKDLRSLKDFRQARRSRAVWLDPPSGLYFVTPRR